MVFILFSLYIFFSSIEFHRWSPVSFNVSSCKFLMLSSTGFKQDCHLLLNLSTKNPCQCQQTCPAVLRSLSPSLNGEHEQRLRRAPTQIILLFNTYKLFWRFLALDSRSSPGIGWYSHQFGQVYTFYTQCPTITATIVSEFFLHFGGMFQILQQITNIQIGDHDL